MPVTEEITAIITLLVGIAAVLTPLFLLLAWSGQRAANRKLDEVNRRLDQLCQTLQESAFQAASHPAPPATATPPAPETEPSVATPAAAPAAATAVTTDVFGSEEPATPGEDLDLGDFGTEESLDLDFPAEPPAEAEEVPPARQEGPGEAAEAPEQASDFAPSDDFELEEEPWGGEAAAGTDDWDFEEEETPAAARDPFTAAATAGIEEADEFHADFDMNEEAPLAAADTVEDDDGFSFETAAEGAEEEQAEEGFPGEEDDFPFDTSPAQEGPTEEELPAEEEAAPEPDIFPMPDNPARPDVSMARCGACDHKLAYKKTLAGKKARCPSCKTAFVLP